MVKYAFFCAFVATIFSACQTNTTSDSKATPITDIKTLPNAMWGKWKNKTYYDQLSLTHSPRAADYYPCAILKIDTAVQSQVSVIDSEHNAAGADIAQFMDGTVSIATKNATLKLSEDQQNLLWHDATQNRDYVFERISSVCLYDDNPLRYQVIARCPLNEAIFYGWYNKLNQQNQPTNQLVMFNNGGAVRGLDPNMDMYRICVDEKCKQLSKIDLVWFTEPNTRTPIDSSNFSRYYTWAFNGDTLHFYTTQNAGTAAQPNLVKDKPYTSLIRRKE